MIGLCKSPDGNVTIMIVTTLMQRNIFSMPYLKSKYKNVIDKALRDIENKVYEPISELEIKCYVTPEPVTYEERKKGIEKELKTGEKWGDIWDCA